MSQLISQVANAWRGADSKTAEVVGDGSRTTLPFVHCRGYCLPDRTGVVAILAIFEAVNTKSNGTGHFAAPNNAAIFNADG